MKVKTKLHHLSSATLTGRPLVSWDSECHTYVPGCNRLVADVASILKLESKQIYHGNPLISGGHRWVEAIWNPTELVAMFPCCSKHDMWESPMQSQEQMKGVHIHTCTWACFNSLWLLKYFLLWRGATILGQVEQFEMLFRQVAVGHFTLYPWCTLTIVFTLIIIVVIVPYYPPQNWWLNPWPNFRHVTWEKINAANVEFQLMPQRTPRIRELAPQHVSQRHIPKPNDCLSRCWG